MNEVVKDRIAHRTMLSHLRMREQNAFGRALNRTGLFMANTADHISSVTHSGSSSLAGGFLYGALKGATLGGVAWTFMYAADIIAVAAAGPAAFVVIAGSAALAFGIVEAAKALNHHAGHEGENLASDRIAQKLGTVPAKEMHRASTVKLGKEIHSKSPPGHVAREMERRNAKSGLQGLQQAESSGPGL